MNQYARPQIIPMNRHRLAKPAKRVSNVQSINPLIPVLSRVGLLVIRLLVAIGSMVLWFTQFGLSVNIRYGQYLLTFDNMPILGVDFSGCLFGSLIVVNSPFGWS